MVKELQKLVHGASPTMINVLNIVQKVAATDANIRIPGENGTGKDLLATDILTRWGRPGVLLFSV